MDNKQKANWLYRIVKHNRDSYCREWIDACAVLASEKTAYAMWEQEHKDDLDRNPYKVESHTKRADTTKRQYDESQELVDFIIEHFLDGVKP